MHKAAQLSQQLEQMNVADGMREIERASEGALYFEVIADAMCIMHDDGSANIIENVGSGVVTSEVISAENILMVLHHYRPFKEVFKGNVQ